MPRSLAICGRGDGGSGNDKDTVRVAMDAFGVEVVSQLREGMCHGNETIAMGEGGPLDVVSIEDDPVGDTVLVFECSRTFKIGRDEGLHGERGERSTS